MSLGVFHSHNWNSSTLFIIFGRIPLWSHLVQDFCLLEVFFFFLNTNSVLLLVISLFRLSVSSWYNLGSLYASTSVKMCPFLLGCSVCCHITVSNSHDFYLLSEPLSPQVAREINIDDSHQEVCFKELEVNGQNDQTRSAVRIHRLDCDRNWALFFDLYVFVLLSTHLEMSFACSLDMTRF